MSDEQTYQDAAGAPGAPSQSPAPAAGKPGFLSTTQGKLIVIGGAVLALLVLLGIVGLLVWLFLFRQTAGSVTTAPVTPPPAVTTAPGSSAASQAVEPTTPPLPVTNANVFVFRDPFIPLLVQAPPSSTVSASSSSTSTSEVSANATENVPANTLVLQDVTTVDGIAKAVLLWNGTTYTAGAGERLDDTPWQVLEVSGNSVVMLFGDTKIGLSVGEGIQK